MKNLILVLTILMFGCSTDTEIVEEPLPIADESNERVFVVYEVGPTPKGNRGDPDPPRILKSNVYPKHERVTLNSARLNEEGIFFDFSEDLHRFGVDLLLDGESLGWIASGIRPGNNNADFSITLTPLPNGPFLEPGKEYLIDLLAGDKAGDVLELEIRFRTNR